MDINGAFIEPVATIVAPRILLNASSFVDRFIVLMLLPDAASNASAPVAINNVLRLLMLAELADK